MVARFPCAYVTPKPSYRCPVQPMCGLSVVVDGTLTKGLCERTNVASLNTLSHRGAPMSSHPVLGKCTWPLARKGTIWCAQSLTYPTNLFGLASESMSPASSPAYTIDWYKVFAPQLGAYRLPGPLRLFIQINRLTPITTHDMLFGTIDQEHDDGQAANWRPEV